MSVDIQALTAKYRPRKWEQFVGQDDMVTAMRGMLQPGKLEPAILLSGPRGSGKSSAARVLTTYLNCTGRDDLTAAPCGQCDVCVGMAKSPPNHRDYIEVNAAEERGIDDVRSITSRAVWMPETRYRVVVFDEAHQLTPAAQPALLKPLEEPPPRVVYILCTTERLKVDEALRSRCVDLTLPAVDPEVTVGLLARICKREKFDLDQKQLLRIARAVDGCPREAVKALGKVIATAGKGEVDVKQVVQQAIKESPERVVRSFLRAVYAGELVAAMSAIDLTDSHAFLLEGCLRRHEQTILVMAGDERTIASYGAGWLEEVAKSGLDMKRAARLYDALVAAVIEARRYLIDARYLAAQIAISFASLPETT